MPTAIIAGATGVLILGRALIQRLSSNPQKWPTIHALSRSQKENYPSNVKHIFVDLTANADQLAKNLQGIEAEYVFFAAYLQKDTEQENWDEAETIQGALLRNFLQALIESGADKKLKRVILVNGAKQYGVHLGPSKLPCEESDPRVEGPGRPPNFYYNQQDILAEMSEGKTWDWVVTIPGDVIGFARGNFMNLASSLAIYATVCREVGEGLFYPGCERSYRAFSSPTSSKLHAEFCEWAAFEPQCSNEILNAVNGDTLTWQSTWSKLAHRFGCIVPPDQFVQPAPLPSLMNLSDLPPILDYANSAGLAGRVGPGAVEQRVDLVRWSQRPEVKKAWETVADRTGLDKSALEKATWQFSGFVLGRNYDLVLSMSKARKLGWTGYCDSWDAFNDVFDELEKEKIIPESRKP